MAEAIVNIVAEVVLNKALQLASEEVSLLWGFKDDLQKLAETLEIIHDLVSDAEGKRISLRSVNRWLKNLSAVASDADDVLDEYGYQVLCHQRLLRYQKFKLNKVRHLFSSSNPLVVRHVLSRKIKEVNSMFDGLYKRANDIGLRPIELFHASSQIREIRKSDSSVDESNIVGRDADRETVLEMLEHPDSKQVQLEVIGIVGIGGQGKTTLAQVVYKHERVESLFDCKIWVCVSDDFDVDRLLKEMIQRLDSGHSQELSNREAMIEKIKKQLIGKKYLLVLDDVWNERPDVWETMRNCLINVGSPMGNKVLVTTRSERVVLNMQPSRHHSLTGLSDSDSLELFCKIAFSQGGPEKTPNLMAISEKLVKQCGNMPLAIKTLASLMWTRKVENEWSKMEENIRWSSQGDGNDIVLSSIRLSYDHLSSLSLKQCFAYCSIFKKDTILEKDKLIQLWAAQGLLNPLKESSHDAAHSEYLIGDNYFNVLRQSYLFINLEKDKYDNVVSCMMHDIVHDLSGEISKGYCCKLLSEQENGTSQAMHLISDGKLFLQFPERNFSKLRTLYLMGKVGRVAPDILVTMESLRALILEDEGCGELPRHIGKLKHLRYLDISETSIRTLPNSICKLFYLQTLRVNYLVKLPPKFGNLVNLRYFYMDQWMFGGWNIPLPNVGRFAYIQTLPYFVVCPEMGCEIKQLGELTCLKGMLRIYGLKHVADKKEAQGAKLWNKSAVVKLEFNWERQGPNADHTTGSDNDDCKDTDVFEALKPHPNLKCLRVFGFEGTSLPSWMLERSSPVLQNLLQIKLCNFNKCEQVPPLGHLPYLKTILLSGLKNVKRIGDDFYGFTDSAAANETVASFTIFPMLKKITLRDMPSLEEWVNAEHPSGMHIKLFLKLEKFRVYECPKLTCLPDIKNLQHLQEFTIDRCSSLKHLPLGLGSCESPLQMQITSCECMTFSPEMENLNHLQEFKIVNCSALKSLPVGLGVSLKMMEISRCGNLTCLRDIENFKHLQVFKLDHCSTLEHLPIGLRSCGFLKRMEINGCNNLTCSPDMENLYTLEELSIVGCSAIEQLPVELGGSLKTLKIQACSNLSSLQDMKKLENLQEFEIVSCSALKHLPVGLGSCGSLKTMKIEGCNNLASLPDMKKLKNLQEFKIINCSALKYLPVGLGRCGHLKMMEIQGCNNLTCSTEIENLEHLQELRIVDCSAIENMPIELGVSLTILKIQSCNSLASLPNMKKLKHLQEFKIVKCPVLQYQSVQLESCISLTTMEIQSCHSLLVMPDMQNFHSLLKLTLEDFKGWNALSNGIENLTLLQELTLGFSLELDSFSWPAGNGKAQQPFPSLAYLRLYDGKKVTQLPKQLQKLPCLSVLEIKKFDALKDLPKWLSNIQTLRTLHLTECQNLKHLPHLPTLESLWILRCPFLVKICDQRSSSEWKNMERVPYYFILGNTLVEHVSSLFPELQTQNPIRSTTGELDSKMFTTCSKMFSKVPEKISSKICIWNQADRSSNHASRTAHSRDHAHSSAHPSHDDTEPSAPLSDHAALSAHSNDHAEPTAPSSDHAEAASAKKERLRKAVEEKIEKEK